jgi:hypothetical protein
MVWNKINVPVQENLSIKDTPWTDKFCPYNLEVSRIRRSNSMEIINLGLKCVVLNRGVRWQRCPPNIVNIL